MQFEKQVAAVAKGTFAKIHLVCQLHPFQEAMSKSLSHFPVGLLQHDLYRIALANYPEASTSLECSSMHNNECPYICPCNNNVLFISGYKVLIISFKVLYSTGQCYLQDCLSLRASTYPTRSERVGILQSLPLNITILW